MIRGALFCMLLAVAGSAGAQTLTPKGDTNSILQEADSLKQSYLQVPDSLRPVLARMDSIRHRFNTAADSIQSEYHQALARLDAATTNVTRTADSLRNLKLPTRTYDRKLRDLKASRLRAEERFTKKFDDLKALTTSKLDALDLPDEYRQPLQKLTGNIDALRLNSPVINIPELNVAGVALPKIDAIGDLTTKAVDFIPADKVGKLSDITSATDGVGADLARQVQGYQDRIPDLAPDVGSVADQAQAYGNDIQRIADGDVSDVAKLSEAAEQQAARLDGMDELQKQSGIVDERKAELAGIANPDKAKEKVVAAAKKVAVDHFAGKQEQLKAAMGKVSRYKQKYSSVSSIRDLPNRPPNPMKDKPFLERLVPGLYLQYQRKDFYLVDVNPYAGYRLSGSFTAGAGWNHRYAYDKDNRAFSARERIFGPRAFVDFKLGKGFIAHVEGECMNTFVPSALVGNPDTGRREWVWSLMTGIKKEYSIYKNLKGTALIQYNLFNRFYKAPYVDRLNARIGFEYVLKR